MKKQSSDQQSHDRRYQERQRAAAARKLQPKLAPRTDSTPAAETPKSRERTR